MRKTKKVTKTETVQETTDILCNKCGKTCSNVGRRTGKNPHQEYEGLLEVEVHGGYDSDLIGDMVSVRFSLCEQCLVALMKTFKIPHEIKDHDLSSEYVSLAQNAKLRAQHSKNSHREWVQAILEKSSNFKKKDLQKKNHKELYEIYHSLPNKKAQNQD